MPTAHTAEKVLIAATMVVTAALLGSPVWKQAKHAGGALLRSAKAIMTTSFEQRRRAFYGDCDKHGYGYVERMTRRFPDAATVPLLRNPKWDARIVPVVLPGFRSRTDERVLIAAGVTDADTRESRIAGARRQGLDGQHAEHWTFLVAEDVDLMTGLEFTLSDRSLSAMSLTLTLLHSAEYPVVLGEWSVEVPAGQSGEIQFHLPRPLPHFSFIRPGLPFVLKIRARGPRSITAVAVLGIKVDVQRYVVVNREGDCFTAIRRDVLADIGRGANHPWTQYLATIRNVQME